MKKKALRILFWAVIVLLVVGLAVLLTWPLVPVLFETLSAQLNGLIEQEALWRTLAICAGILAGAAVLVLLLIPVLLYAVRKLLTYLSLAVVCAQEGCKMRLARTPFASLGGMKAGGDIVITTAEGTLHLYFLDIVFPFRRALTVPSTEGYVLSSVTAGRISKNGGSAPGTHMNPAGGRTTVLRATGHTLDEGTDRLHPFPPVERREGEAHILLLSSYPTETKLLRDGVALPLDNGVTAGPFVFCRVKQIKKALKGELHTSLFSSNRT